MFGIESIKKTNNDRKSSFIVKKTSCPKRNRCSQYPIRHKRSFGNTLKPLVKHTQPTRDHRQIPENYKNQLMYTKNHR